MLCVMTHGVLVVRAFQTLVSHLTYQLARVHCTSREEDQRLSAHTALIIQPLSTCILSPSIPLTL